MDSNPVCQSPPRSEDSEDLLPRCSQDSPEVRDISTWNENEVFAAWRLSEGSEKERLQLALVKLLTKHGHAVCWNKIPDLQGDHGWIVNESVYRAIAHEKGFKGKSKFSTWFQRIVLNICNNALKSKQRRGEEVEIVDSVEYGKGGPGSVMSGIWFEEIARNGTKDDKKLLRLLLQGYTQDEAAKMMGLGNVRVKWQRLKERLRDAGRRTRVK